MDDDCYPTISMNTATTNLNRLHNEHIGHHHIHHHNHHNNNNNNNVNNNNHSNHNSLINSLQNICNNDTASISSCSSDVDIDDSNIKEEPLSPDSSCPSSPNGSLSHCMNMNLSNMAAFTNTDLVFEHKVCVVLLNPPAVANQHQNLN